MISCEPTEERLEFGALLCFLRREHFKLNLLSFFVSSHPERSVAESKDAVA